MLRMDGGLAINQGTYSLMNVLETLKGLQMEGKTKALALVICHVDMAF